MKKAAHLGGFFTYFQLFTYAQSSASMVAAQ